MAYVYHPGKRIFVAGGAVLTTLLFAVIRARRGLSLITFSVIFFSYLLFIFNSQKKIVVIYLSFLIIILGALYASSIYRISNNRIFGQLSQRGDEDTRTGVEIYFYDDMKINDWIFGKGITGEYFCPNIEEDQVSNYRNVIETGYLQVILKGGLISLSLLLLIIMPAFSKGVFFSKNLLSKAAGVWILIFTMSLYPATPVSFNLNYLLVWISVGICYSSKFRKMTDAEINNQFFNA